MYETTIAYYPLTGNICLKIVDGESFFYEEEGVSAILTPKSTVFIHTPAPEVYCK